MTPFYDKAGATLYNCDCRAGLAGLADGSVQTCVTSPPYYGLRNYGVDGQLGLERTPEEYVEKLVLVFREVRRVLRDDGTLWLNLGDSYASGKGTCFNPGGNTSSFNVHLKACNVHPLDRGNKSTLEASGLKPKDLIGIPWRTAFALQADGWYLRSDIIWDKCNPMPESVTDRPTKAHEYLFLLSKSQRYYYDGKAIAEPCVESNDDRPRMGQGPNTQYKQKRAEMVMPNGKHSRTDKQAAGRRIVDNVAKARANGANHDSPFGSTRNKRSVWTVATKPFKAAHFATFPPDLIRPCILAGCAPAGTVLDPFAGSGTTLMIAREQGCRAVGFELNEDYCRLAVQRLAQAVLPFVESQSCAP